MNGGGAPRIPQMRASWSRASAPLNRGLLVGWAARGNKRKASCARGACSGSLGIIASCSMLFCATTFIAEADYIRCDRQIWNTLLSEKARRRVGREARQGSGMLGSLVGNEAARQSKKERKRRGGNKNL
eukprot:6206188-Pleurochrysis_carterae.AAC.2